MAAEPEGRAAEGSNKASDPKAQAATVVAGDPSDRDDGPNSLRQIGGSESKAFNNVVANQVLSTLWMPPGTSATVLQQKQQAAVAALMEFKPTDAIEGMMAAQAIGLHSAALECLRRAMIPEQGSEASDQLRRQGANMSRAFLEVVAALDRKRGKGTRQVVRVERVMVAPGAQAIIGNVQAGAAGRSGQAGEGVGHEGENRGEPHATLAGLAHDASFGTILPPLRSADPSADALPVSGDGQWTLPDARRR